MILQVYEECGTRKLEIVGAPTVGLELSKSSSIPRLDSSEFLSFSEAKKQG